MSTTRYGLRCDVPLPQRAQEYVQLVWHRPQLITRHPCVAHNLQRGVRILIHTTRTSTSESQHIKLRAWSISPVPTSPPPPACAPPQ